MINAIVVSNTIPELRYNFEDIDGVNSYQDGAFTVMKYGEIIAKFDIKSFHFVINHVQKD